MATKDDTFYQRRLLRLQSICSERGLGASDLAREIAQGNQSYWSRILTGKKVFGGKVARNIETKMQLPDGFLDKPTKEAIDTPKFSARALRIAHMFDSIPRGREKDVVYEILQRILRM